MTDFFRLSCILMFAAWLSLGDGFFCPVHEFFLVRLLSSFEKGRDQLHFFWQVSYLPFSIVSFVCVFFAVVSMEFFF